MAYTEEQTTEPLGEEVVEILRGVTTELWIITILFFVGGDLLTTLIGLQIGGVAEVGPAVAPLIQEFGLQVMFPLKLLALVICIGLWRVTPAPHDVGVPLGLAVLGVLVTGWNVGVLGIAFLG